MVEILGRISTEDLVRYREVCALVEVAKSPPVDMTTGAAKQAWIEYYALVAELHDRYEIAEEDRLDVTISPGSGLIRLEEE